GWAQFHVRPTALLAVTLGGLIFGVGMVIYGYCPGTGVAAIATGSIHALVGAVGMLVGGGAYALSHGWMRERVPGVADYGRITLTDITGIPAFVWFAVVAGGVVILWRLTRRSGRDSAAG